jgi:hypothetical protein
VAFPTCIRRPGPDPSPVSVERRTRGGAVAEELEEQEEPQPPRGHVRVVYLGPVAPHWEVQSTYGEASVIDPFRDRTLARLTLLPPHDPQFRRNRERVVRDAEREYLELEWDLGIPEEEAPPAPEAAASA